MDKVVQCNLILEKQLERGNLRLIQKRSKCVSCNIKPSQCSVKTSTADLQVRNPTARSIGTNTDLEENVESVFFDRILYALRTVDQFRGLQHEVRYGFAVFIINRPAQLEHDTRRYIMQLSSKINNLGRERN